MSEIENKMTPGLGSKLGMRTVIHLRLYITFSPRNLILDNAPDTVLYKSLDYSPTNHGFSTDTLIRD